MSVMSIVRQVKALECGGKIRVVRTKREDGSNAANRYRIMLTEHSGSNVAPSITELPGVVSELHQGGLTKLPGVVSQSYQGSNTELPKPVIEPVSTEPVRETAPLTPQGGVAPKNRTADFVGSTAKPKKRKTNTINFDSLPESISHEAALGFIDHRKLLKKPLTQRAFNIAMNEAAKAPEIDMTPDEAIDQCGASGWLGIKLEWLTNKSAGGAQSSDSVKKEFFEIQARKRAAKNQTTINGECQRIDE